MNVWDTLQEAVARAGDRTAVVDGGERLSYEELARGVRTLAGRISAAGAAPGDRVAVLERNTLFFLEAYYAAAGAGVVLVPLNHRLAPAELAEILRDAGARILLASRTFAAAVDRVRGDDVPVTKVLWAEERGSEPASFAAQPAPGDAPAQLYYTSGTTGRPKGVVLTHENVCVHAAAAVAELGLSEADRWGHFAPVFHLADAWACFAITAVGGKHVMCPRFEPEAALGLIERQGITITNLIPTMLNLMTASPQAADTDLSSMRLVLSGGAPIAPASVARAIEVFGCEYVQTYGMTETSPYLTLGILHDHLRELPETEQLRYRARTGRAFRGVELEVVDERGHAVAPDDRAVGEIRVRGATVSPGYWRAPEETSAVFRDGWLYTGDLATIDPEGYVDIVDRKKDVILSGGETVYSTEVENALYEHPAVLETAVVGLPHPLWGEAVTAAVVFRAGRDVPADELVAFCRARIAAYKSPKDVHVLEELPRTGTGKISKRLLRELLMR